MFKILLATFALCVCVLLGHVNAYGPGSLYGKNVGSSVGLVGIPVPKQPILGYPIPSIADYQLAIGSNAQAAKLLNLALALPQPSGPIVGVNPVYQGVPVGNYGAVY